MMNAFVLVGLIIAIVHAYYLTKQNEKSKKTIQCLSNHLKVVRQNYSDLENVHKDTSEHRDKLCLKVESQKGLLDRACKVVNTFLSRMDRCPLCTMFLQKYGETNKSITGK
jgi:hypothetical protein